MSRSTRSRSQNASDNANSPTEINRGRLSEDDEEVESSPSSNNSASVPTLTNYIVAESNAPFNPPVMPVLVSTSSTHIVEWNEQLMLYADRFNIKDLLKESNQDSLKLFIRKAEPGRTFSSIVDRWLERQGKIYSLLRIAVYKAIGSQLFRDLEMDASENRTERSHLLLAATDERPAGAPPHSDPSTWTWLEDFKHGNAHYLWSYLIQSYAKYTGFDKMRLFNQYCNLPKYKEGDDPTPLLIKFEDNKHKLETAGVRLPADLHWVLWLNAIPEGMKTVQNQLGMVTEGTYTMVFEHLKNLYNKSLIDKPFKKNKRDQKPKDVDESQEQLNAANDQNGQKNAGKRPRPKESVGDRSDQKPSQRPRLRCDYCEKDFHTADRCRELKKDQGRISSALQTKSTKGKVYQMCFVEQPEVEQECAMAGEEKDQDKTTIFIFDSGATTHMTKDRKLLTHVKQVPEISVTTAVRGAVSVIRERGRLSLNKNKILQDVAYVANASNNLISEGRICDAGNTIIKNKLFLVVRDEQGHQILKGPRVNRLWVYYLGGSVPPPRPINTLISKRKRRAPGGAGEVDESEEEEEKKMEESDSDEGEAEYPFSPAIPSSSSSSSSSAPGVSFADKPSGAPSAPRIPKKKNIRKN
jgi:hypothetical protein